MLVVHASTLNKTYLFIITILSEHLFIITTLSEHLFIITILSEHLFIITILSEHLFIITILSEHFQTPTENSEKETKLISLMTNTWPLTFRVLVQGKNFSLQLHT